MKLGKEEIKKIVLSVMLGIAVIYGYFAFLMNPLHLTETKDGAAIATLEPQIAAAKKQLVQTAEIEKKAPAADELLRQITAQIPDGEPVAWFPPRMADFFKRQGIEHAATHLNVESPEKDLPGFRQIVWSIDLPKVDFMTLGHAVATLENEEPLLEIKGVSIEGSAENPNFQHAILTVAAIVKQ